MWPVSVVGRRTNEYNRVIWSWTKNNSETDSLQRDATRDLQTTESRQTNMSERGAAESGRNNNNINNNKHKQTKTQREKKKQKTTD